MKGRKRKEDSRATELRQRLVVWQQTPESMRPPLRALARELGTSHALLQHYLRNLGMWEARESWKRSAEIRARATAEGRVLAPWEREQARALDYRGGRLFAVAAFSDSIRRYEQEMERDINEGKMPPLWYAKLFRLIASVKGVRAPEADQVSRDAEAMLQKYFSPEGREATRERVRKARRNKPRTARSEAKEMRLHRLANRFEKLGGILLLDDGKVSYFIATEDGESRAVVAELAKHRDGIRELLMGVADRVNFDDLKIRICQRFSAGSIKPLDSSAVEDGGTGNSTGTKEGGDGLAVTLPAVVS